MFPFSGFGKMKKNGFNKDFLFVTTSKRRTYYVSITARGAGIILRWPGQEIIVFTTNHSLELQLISLIVLLKILNGTPRKRKAKNETKLFFDSRLD